MLTFHSSDTFFKIFERTAKLVCATAYPANPPKHKICFIFQSPTSLAFQSPVLLCKAMPLVDVQKYVDFTDFTAHSRNFKIIYLFKSCKYSLRFVVQVCLDHAAPIYIWKVKKYRIEKMHRKQSADQGLYTCAAHAASTVLCAKRSRCMYTTTLAVAACTVGIYV